MACLGRWGRGMSGYKIVIGDWGYVARKDEYPSIQTTLLNLRESISYVLLQSFGPVRFPSCALLYVLRLLVIHSLYISESLANQASHLTNTAAAGCGKFDACLGTETCTTVTFTTPTATTVTTCVPTATCLAVYCKLKSPAGLSWLG